MRWIVVAAVTVAVAFAQRVSIPAKLTLEQAMEIAFGNSRALAKAVAQVRQGEGQAAQARSSLLPQISVGISETLQTVNPRALGIDVPLLPPRVGPFQVVDARGAVTQNLLNIGARERSRAGGEQARTLVSLAENARELLAAQVAISFAEALRAQSAAATLGEQTELSRRLLATADQRYEAGAASRLDAMRSRQQVHNLEQNLAEATQRLTAAKLQLANLLHAAISDSYELLDAGGTMAPPPPAAAALDDAMRARPDYRALQSQIRASEHRLAAVKAQRYPTVQLRADYGQIGKKPFENLNTFRVQGVLNVPIYTGGRIEGEQVEAEGKLDELRAQLDELQSQIETEVQTAIAAMEAARREIEAAGQTVALAREEVELSATRFDSGVADNTEVVNAQDRLSRAEDNRVRAVFRWQVARAQLLRSTGMAEKSYRK